MLPIFFLFAAILLYCTSSVEEEIIEQPCTLQLYPPLDTVITSHTSFTREYYPQRIQEFMMDSIFQNSIVMLGNSLTEQGEDWSDKLGQENVSNRGISGDNTDGLSARLGEIICSEPRIVFVMIGTNDLWTPYTEIEVASSIDEIGNYLSSELPDANIYVQTIMPLESGHSMSERLIGINTALKSKEDVSYILIDTFAEMANNEGFLESQYTTDGVHLTSLGYEKWAAFLKQFVD